VKRRKSSPTPSLQAVGYVRVSTEDQAREGVSLEAQRAKIHAWCEANGYALLAVHEDAGLSGKSTDNRPGLQQALEQACRERAALVAYSISRLSRSTRDLLALAERLEHAEADLVSLTERIDTTSAAGRMVFRMLSVLGEFERELVGERTSMAMRFKSSKGEHVGRPPRGTRIEGKRLVVSDEGELAVYRRAVALRRSGLTYAEVAAALSAEGFTPLRGRRFWPSAIHRLVPNPHLAQVVA